MSNQPVYRTRNHAYSCRCGRCPQSRPGDWGLIGPLLLFGGIFTVIGFWPAMVWHGYGGPTGTAWRWDIHSTIAEAVYFGVIGFIAWMCWLGSRPARSAPPKGRLRVEATTPEQLRPPPASVPRCRHLRAVRVDSASDPDLIYHCWCPDCDPDCRRPLPAAFRLPCCGTEPGTGIRPTVHQYNCPHLTGDPR